MFALTFNYEEDDILYLFCVQLQSTTRNGQPQGPIVLYLTKFGNSEREEAVNRRTNNTMSKNKDRQYNVKKQGQTMICKTLHRKRKDLATRSPLDTRGETFLKYVRSHKTENRKLNRPSI